MDSGIRKLEKMTLYDEDDYPVEVTILSLIFPGKLQEPQFQSGRTAFGRKIKLCGPGMYASDAGTILRACPAVGRRPRRMPDGHGWVNSGVASRRRCGT
jgi:hypothetical protein